MHGLSLVRALKTLFRVLWGTAAAATAAAIVQLLMTLGPGYFAAHPSENAVVLVALVTSHFFLFVLCFGVPIALLCEVLAIRWLGAYLAFGFQVALAGFIIQYVSAANPQAFANNKAVATFALSGLAGGLAYWALAGRKAG